MPASEPDEPSRPTTILIAYVWDALLALGAILIALAPFSGGLEVSGRSVSLPASIQILLALEGGLYAAAVITVMISLTRPDRWVRRAQIAVLLLPIALIAVSDAVEQVVHHDVSAVQLLAGLLVVLFDAVILFAMTAPRLAAWYHRPGGMPAWVRLTLGLFLLAGIAAIVVESVL